MNLVGGDRRPPKQGQSYVCEGTLLRRAGSPVFPLHHAEVRRGAAERDSIPLVIRAHSAERATPGDPAFEVVNVAKAPDSARQADCGCHFCQATESGTGQHRRSPSSAPRGPVDRKSFAPLTPCSPMGGFSGALFEYTLCSANTLRSSPVPGGAISAPRRASPEPTR